MRILTVWILCFGTAVAQAADTRECTVASVREVVLSQDRAGPQRAVDSDTTAQARFQVILKCKDQRVFAVFATSRGFDAAIFHVGATVLLEGASDEISIKAKGVEAKGTRVARNKSSLQ